MSRGTGIGLVLIAVGAILAFAVTVTVGGVDLRAVGWILMIVGVLGLVMDLVLFAPRRRGDDYTTRGRPPY
jgi:Flp pilus assembly protein protease CpaA